MRIGRALTACLTLGFLYARLTNFLRFPLELRTRIVIIQTFTIFKQVSSSPGRQIGAWRTFAKGACKPLQSDWPRLCARDNREDSLGLEANQVFQGSVVPR